MLPPPPPTAVWRTWGLSSVSCSPPSLDSLCLPQPIKESANESCDKARAKGVEDGRLGHLLTPFTFPTPLPYPKWLTELVVDQDRTVLVSSQLAF